MNTLTAVVPQFDQGSQTYVADKIGARQVPPSSVDRSVSHLFTLIIGFPVVPRYDVHRTIAFEFSLLRKFHISYGNVRL